MSIDGTYVAFGDPNSSRDGVNADGSYHAYLETAFGWRQQRYIASPLPNAQFGSSLGFNNGITRLVVAAPNATTTVGRGQVFLCE